MLCSRCVSASALERTAVPAVVSPGDSCSPLSFPTAKAMACLAQSRRRAIALGGDWRAAALCGDWRPPAKLIALPDLALGGDWRPAKLVAEFPDDLLADRARDAEMLRLATVQGSGSRVQGPEFRVQSPESRVQSSG
jgi:hypothetical protein